MKTRPPRWILLTHQLPNEPSNLRVKVWRKLQALGAVAVKNSIYALPNRAATREDFDWLRKEIIQSGGEATVFTADSLAEKDDQQIVKSFQEARGKDYDELAKAARAFNDKVRSALDGGHLKAETLERLEKHWSDLQSARERAAKIDFFAAPGRASAESALKEGHSLLNRAKSISVRRAPEPPPPVAAKDLTGRVWVTRASPHIDRLASAWLVRRFVDPKARFKFVASPYAARAKELRFDMPEGEFTHFGDWCTFETLAHRLRLHDPALAALAEIVHDIDLKDRKFGRPEASGVALAIRGLCRRHTNDAPRLAAGIDFFEGVYSALTAELKK
ncbi:MAG TPA: chromate resistance protein ChrB domain-containing protein [Elusimicrobiota bacterium]|nr:chromate resistance protein ChrB domain-containing protein [Elusimicrobiota bacterium]